jgi:hypothetical protein
MMNYMQSNLPTSRNSTFAPVLSRNYKASQWISFITLVGCYNSLVGLAVTGIKNVLILHTKTLRSNN